MRKLIVTLMATIACCLTQAQTPLLLGKSHAMQRVKVEKKYLLLPVQEREEIATIKVLVDNQQVTRRTARSTVRSITIPLCTDG